MPNPELDDFLTDTVTRKRPVDKLGDDGENKPDWNDVVENIPWSLQRKGGDMAPRTFGLVPEATMWGFGHPDADVKKNDLLLVTGGPHSSERYWVRQIDDEFGDHLISELELEPGTPDA